MQIRCIVEQDYSQVRQLRLAALQDSPDSFADSLRSTRDKPTQYWKELTKSLCKEHVMFILEQDGELVGSIYGLSDSINEKTGRVAGMWVSPSYRRRGFGKSLLMQVASWARSSGFNEMRLWAPAKKPRVIEFYQSNGFELTGNRQQTPKPNLQIVEMKRVFVV